MKGRKEESSFDKKHLWYHIKLMKGKALRKHSLHEKTAASVLLKLFISKDFVWHLKYTNEIFKGIKRCVQIRYSQVFHV